MKREGISQEDWPNLLRKALREQEAALAERGEGAAGSLRASQTAAATLLNWALPERVVVAALLAPLIEGRPEEAARLGASYPWEAISRAEKLNEWRAKLAYSGNRSTEGGADPQMLLRRSLFRETYLDLPGLSLILLLLADHDARFTGSSDKGMAETTLAVFLPLVEMLGLWQLRRSLIERSMGLLHPEDCREIADKWLTEGTAEKERAYTRIEQKLWEEAEAEGISPLPKVEPLLYPAAVSFHSHRYERVSKTDIARRLSVKVLCATRSDCYRVLGIVHRLGRPTEPGFAGRFSDYIAAPRPAGYRALHTSIIYQASTDSEGADTETRIVIDFRILTQAMNELNEWGIVAALYRRPHEHSEAPAWWNRLDTVAQKLRPRYREGEHKYPVSDRLSQFELGTQSDQLYLFTPLGEIMLLKEGSGPLDFVYALHTDLIQQVSDVKVNGQNVPLNFPLRNGDLIEIKYDKRGGGPDLAWIGLASSQKARANIRRSLVSRAQAIHEGRRQIEELLIKTLEYYARERKYQMTIKSKHLDEALDRAVQELHLADADAMYERVEMGTLSAAKLVRRIISAEFALALTTRDGQTPPYPPERIEFCDRCRPVPGDELIAAEKRISSGKSALMLHRRGNTACPGAVGVVNPVDIRWEAPGVSDRDMLFFTIEAEDRDMLLEDVISTIYDEPSAHLSYVKGQVSADGSAEITLGVEAVRLDQLAGIGHRIERVDDVHHVHVQPPSTAQRLALQAPGARRRQPNPYTTHEVYDRWMFYDREESRAEIHRWLDEGGTDRVMILHGQRRVGKSSLARFLMREIRFQHGRDRAVFVDLQKLSSFDAESLADLVLCEVYSELKAEIPERKAAEGPIQWLDRGLAEAAVEPGGGSLLIMIDEFNVLLDKEEDGRRDPVIFGNLRAILNSRREIYWMLIIQDTHFLDRKRQGSAGALFQQTRTLHLLPLDPPWARKLTVEPVERCGILYDDPDIPRQIYKLTNGVPYLIQLLCFQMIDRVRSLGRCNITADDLVNSTQLMISAGSRYFAHFTDSLTPERQVVLAAAAQELAHGGWGDVTQLTAAIASREAGFDAHTLSAALIDLENQGIITLRQVGDAAQALIPIELFHTWAKRTFKLKEALDAWRGPRIRAKPATGKGTTPDENPDGQ
ncbi:MAG: TGS domain-containing protein [Chloroflexia bacterium]